MKHSELEKLKVEIQIKAKNGIDFILAASIVWFGIYIIWTFDYTPYNKSIFTFIFGSILLPLAYGFSKILKTKWKIEDNPLQPLGLWLNFAQLFYFPFLIFILLASPKYFIMTYAIITGAHLFPYAWFYDEIAYAIVAGLISVGSLILALNLTPETMYYIPLFTVIVLLFLAIKIILTYTKFRESN
jgi:hypothetical protein